MIISLFIIFSNSDFNIFKLPLPEEVILRQQEKCNWETVCELLEQSDVMQEWMIS